MSRRWRPGLWSTCPREVLAPAMRGVICTGKLVGDMYKSRREAARGGGKAAPLLLPKARAIELGPERALALRPRLAGPFLGRHRRNARRAPRVRVGRNRQHRGPLAPYDDDGKNCEHYENARRFTCGFDHAVSVAMMFIFCVRLRVAEGDTRLCSCGDLGKTREKKARQECFAASDRLKLVVSRCLVRAPPAAAPSGPS